MYLWDKNHDIDINNNNWLTDFSMKNTMTTNISELSHKRNMIWISKSVIITVMSNNKNDIIESPKKNIIINRREKKVQIVKWNLSSHGRRT